MPSLRSPGLGTAIALFVTLLVNLTVTPCMLLLFCNFFKRSIKPDPAWFVALGNCFCCCTANKKVASDDDFEARPLLEGESVRLSYMSDSLAPTHPYHVRPGSSMCLDARSHVMCADDGRD